MKARDAMALAAAVLLAAGFVKLGLWQLDRRAWKEQLIASMQAAIDGKTPPLSVPGAASRLNEDRSADFLPVTATGTFATGQDRYVYSIVDGQPGWHVITPLALEGGPRVLIDRGAIPDSLRGETPAPAADPVNIRGFARRGLSPAYWFDPVNDPARNRWYRADVPSLLASLPPAGPAGDIPLLIIAAPQPGAPGEWPRPENPDPASLPNNHLQYALTWFSLAGLLVLLTGIYAAGSRRRAADR